MSRFLAVDDLVRVLPHVAESLRKSGHRVGTAEILEVARLAESYASLEARESLSEDEIELIVDSILKNRKAVAGFMGELRRVLSGSRMRERVEMLEREIVESLDALGVKPGWRVSKKRASRLGRSAVAAYMKLRSIGVIRGPPGRERVVDQQSLREVVYSLARQGFGSLDEAYRSKPSRDSGDVRLMEAEAGISPKLEDMDEKSLVQLGFASIKKGNPHMLRRVGLELARRARLGGLTRPGDAFKIIRRAGVLDRETMVWMLARDPSLASEETVDPGVVARAAEMVGVEEAGIMVSKLVRSATPEEVEELLERLPPEALWSVKSHRLEGDKALLLESAAKAAASLRSAMKHTETGGEGWREMGIVLAEDALLMASKVPSSVSIGRLTKDVVSSMVDTALGILSIEAEDAGNPSAIYSILKRVDLPTAVKVLRFLYSRASSDEEREVLVRSLERLLYRFSESTGMRLLPRRVRTEIRSPRVDVRRSILESIRKGGPSLVYRRRLRSGRLSLALDVSSSMIEYSSWAIAVASIFLSNISKLVLFSHTTVVLDGPLTRREVARALITAEFRGYTDISTALLEAVKPGVKRVVVVTDLQQTVESTPLPEAVTMLGRRGYKTVFITPPSARQADLESVREAGARVIVAWNPRQVATGVLRLILRRS